VRGKEGVVRPAGKRLSGADSGDGIVAAGRADVLHGIEGEHAEQAAEFSRHGSKADVGAEAGEGAGSEARLGRIEFPRMAVDAGRGVVDVVEEADGRGYVGEREEAEVGATPCWGGMGRGKGDGGWRDFEDLA
jgi:hypothetical protein